MLRKKKELPPAKEHFIGIRVTNDLYEVLQSEASASNISLSDYVRKLLTSRRPTIHRTTEIVYDDPELLKVFSNLAACGNNLNQIAAYLNQNGTMTNPMWKEIKSCITDLYEMRDNIKEIVGEYRGSHLTHCN